MRRRKLAAGERNCLGGEGRKRNLQGKANPWMGLFLSLVGHEIHMSVRPIAVGSGSRVALAACYVSHILIKVHYWSCFAAALVSVQVVPN